MAGWNGTGTFTGPTYIWVNDLNAGIVITASRFDQNDTDYTAGVNACLAKNGENAATGNLNIGGFRLTSVGNASARTDALTAAQAQDGSAGYILAAGTNTITAALAPAIAAYANGQAFWLKMANTTTAAATLSFNGLAALNLYYSDLVTQIVAGALIQNGIYEFAYNSSLNSGAGGFEVINPSRVAGSYTGTPTGLTVGTTVPASIGYVIGIDGKSASQGIPQFTGTSNATTKTITGMPATLAPTTGQNFNSFVRDGGTIAQGSINIAAAAVIITFGNGVGFGPGGFTASGTAAFPAIIGTGVQTINYQISP